jgi:hypothetical protein
MHCAGICASGLLPVNWAAYFQAAGKAKSINVTLSKQGFFLIPLVPDTTEFFRYF